MSYQPTSPPVVNLTLEILLRYVFDELSQIAHNMDETKEVQLFERHRAPERPREGMIVLADGTNWNPGSGAGFYGYRGGAWRNLG